MAANLYFSPAATIRFIDDPRCQPENSLLDLFERG